MCIEISWNDYIHMHAIVYYYLSSLQIKYNINHHLYSFLILSCLKDIE